MSTPLSACRPIAALKTLFFPGKVVNSCVGFTAVRHLSVTQSRNMKLVQFSYKNNPDEVRAGYIENGSVDKVVDINKADSTLPVKLLEILKLGGIEKVKQ